ncbi:hypothetical protein ACC717_27280 [Rhizobium ruizarguesonis]
MTDNSKTPPAKKTIQDPPEYTAAPEDPSQAAPSSSLDKMPPWSIPIAENVALEDPSEIPENVAHSPGGNVQGAWNSGHPGGVAIEDPSEAAPSNSSGRGKPPEPVSQDLRGQLKWNEQRTGETDDWLGGPQNGEEATYQQNGQQAVRPSGGTGDVSGDWLGGPQNGEKDEVNDRGRVPTDDIKEKKAPKGSLSGGVDEQEGGGPDV